jgi:hypothetical protein
LKEEPYDQHQQEAGDPPLELVEAAYPEQAWCGLRLADEELVEPESEDDDGRHRARPQRLALFDSEDGSA